MQQSRRTKNLVLIQKVILYSHEYLIHIAELERPLWTGRPSERATLNLTEEMETLWHSAMTCAKEKSEEDEQEIVYLRVQRKTVSQGWTGRETGEQRPGSVAHELTGSAGKISGSTPSPLPAYPAGGYVYRLRSAVQCLTWRRIADENPRCVHP